MLNAARASLRCFSPEAESAKVSVQIGTCKTAGAAGIFKSLMIFECPRPRGGRFSDMLILLGTPAEQLGICRRCRYGIGLSSYWEKFKENFFRFLEVNGGFPDRVAQGGWSRSWI